MQRELLPTRVTYIVRDCSFQTLSAARAEAETIRLLGESQAKSREMIGLAEAEGMRLKAASFKQYGDAATLSLVLDTLPRVRLPLLPSISISFSFSFALISYWLFFTPPLIGLPLDTLRTFVPGLVGVLSSDPIRKPAPPLSNFGNVLFHRSSGLLLLRWRRRRLHR